MTTRPPHMKPPALPSPSPLQALVTDPTLLATATHPHSLHTLALQIQHTLQYQHDWSALAIHTRSPLTHELLPRPLLSGLPPKRAYLHPDEQIDLLKKADQGLKEGGTHGKTALELMDEPEREWVLPTRLSEKWTLHRLHDVFGAISVVPPETEAGSDEDRRTNPWRTSKRVVLATIDTDSTAVYYMVHEGMVKPRQN